jgi:cytochrome c
MLRTDAWETALLVLSVSPVPGKIDRSMRTTMARRCKSIRAPLAAVFAIVCAVSLAPVVVPAQEGNAEEGAEVFKKCRACHDVGPEAKNKVGPILNGIVGRAAGTIEGYNYSEANKTAGTKGLVWTEEVMFKYLEAPLSFMPGTKMAFAGLKDDQDRKDVIAYLKKFSNK